MRSLLQQIPRIEPIWDEARAHKNWQRLAPLKRARRRKNVLAGALVATLAFAIFFRPEPRVVQFADGSTAQLLDDRSRVERGPEARSARLLDGRARFEVTHDAAHGFRVQAGDVGVEVLGTRFVVAKEGAHTRVAVERGRVRVGFAGGAVELGAGEGGLFPPDDPVKAMLDAADRARAHARPAEAIRPLELVVAAHPEDPRAPLAAFTLGRLYVDELHRPREAAAAFARARALAPDGPLAADALVREKKCGR